MCPSAQSTDYRRSFRHRQAMKKTSLIRKYGSFLEGLNRLPPRCCQKIINESPKKSSTALANVA